MLVAEELGVQLAGEEVVAEAEAVELEEALL